MPCSRRELLSGLAAGGTAAVAGCGGDGGPGDATTSPQDDGTPTGVTGDGTTSDPPEDPAGDDREQTDIYEVQGTRTAIEQAQMNRWNSKTGYAPPYYNNPEPVDRNDYGHYLSMMTAGYEFIDGDDGVLLGPVNETFRYHDDREFDPQDFLDQQKHVTEPFLQVSAGTYDDSIFYYDDLRLRGSDGMGGFAFDFTQGGNPTLNLRRTLTTDQGLAMNFKTNPVLHEEFVEKGKEASSASELQSVVQGILTHEIPIEQGVQHMGMMPGDLESFTKSMVVSGWREPYASEEFPWGFNNQENPDTPWFEEEWGDKPICAGAIGLPFIEDASIVSRNTVLNAAIAGKIDSISDIRDPTIIDQFPDGWRIVPGSATESHGLAFSPGGAFGDRGEQARALRQGIAYLLDPGQYSEVARFPPPAHKMSGLPYPSVEREWLGSLAEYNDTFTNYGSSGTGWVNEEKGYEKLREAGLERGGEGEPWRWADSGDRLTPTLVYQVGAGPTISGHAAVVEEQLKRHGITVELNNVQTARMTTLVETEDGRAEWDLALLPGQFQTVPHPFMGYRTSCGLGSVDLTDETSFGAGDFRNTYGEVEVPMPVGDPDGDLETVNYDRMVRRLPQVSTTEAEQALVEKISWTLNQWVPMVALALQPDPNAINMAKFTSKVPLDHPAWRFGGTGELMPAGILDANPDYTPSVTPPDETDMP